MREQQSEPESVESKRQRLALLRRALSSLRQQQELRDIPYKSARALDPGFIGIAPLDGSDENAGRLKRQIEELAAELGETE